MKDLHKDGSITVRLSPRASEIVKDWRSVTGQTFMELTDQMITFADNHMTKGDIKRTVYEVLFDGEKVEP